TYLNANAAPQISERVAAGVARSFRMSAAVAPQEDSTGAHSANPAKPPASASNAPTPIRALCASPPTWTAKQILARSSGSGRP
ncbi:hypothetical protein ACOJAF_14080, partial [Corynebacterium striatum]